jgi:Tol biopolymer transport system component
MTREAKRMMKWMIALLGMMALLIGVRPAPANAAACSDGLVQRISVLTGGAEGAGGVVTGLSNDGRYVVMLGNGLSLTDATAFTDVYVHDRANCVTALVSVATGGVQANADATGAAISGDGRYVAFTSAATNLAPSDDPGDDVFVHDTVTGVTARISDANGGELPKLSADGRYVAYKSMVDTQVYRFDRQTSTRTLASVAAPGTPVTVGAVAFTRAITPDGRYVLFASLAPYAPTDTNSTNDGYVRDMVGGTTERVTLTTGGAQIDDSNAVVDLSENARYVLFYTTSGLVAGDTNGASDVYVYDRQTQTVELISRRENGSAGNTMSIAGGISGDGRFAVFYSLANNFILGDSNGVFDVFLHDRTYRTTRLASRADSGAIGNGQSSQPFISRDGRVLAYTSGASNLVPNDTNGTGDVFAGDARVIGQANWLNNGDFSTTTLGNGNGTWGRFGTPTDAAMVYQFSGGRFEFYRATGGTSAVLLQNTGVPLPANTPITAYMALGNTSPSRMRVLAMLHSQDFSDLQVCVFWLEPGTSDAIYVMETYTTKAWAGASLSLYASPDRPSGWIQVDNVDLTWTPGGRVDATLCNEPIAFGNDPEPDSGNLVVNGDFTQEVIGGTPIGRWGYFATPNNTFINFRFNNGVFEFYRVTGGQSAVILQNTVVAIPPYNAIEATMLLGNSSSQRKRVLVMLHDGDFQDLQICSFWLQPNTPLDTYIMLTWTTKPWAAAHISLYASPDTAQGWIQVDNVVYRHRPALAPIGTECYERGALPFDIESRLADAPLPDLPTLIPTALAITPSPYVPALDGAPMELSALAEIESVPDSGAEGSAGAEGGVSE